MLTTKEKIEDAIKGREDELKHLKYIDSQLIGENNGNFLNLTTKILNPIYEVSSDKVEHFSFFKKFWGCY